MNLLNRDVKNITYEEIVDFCKLGILEHAQLDYKLRAPKDLSKKIATFANTIGGLFIIGVEEDDKGLPKTFVGIDDDGKLEEQIHQFASNVTPLPTYEVSKTNPVNGKVFILLKVAEGSATPYTTLFDPTVWVRVGNTSTAASREEFIRLVSKQEKAKTLRDTNILFADNFFKLCLMMLKMSV